MLYCNKYIFSKCFHYLCEIGIIGVVGLLPLPSQRAVISIPMTLTVGECSMFSTSLSVKLCSAWTMVSFCKLNNANK